MSLKVLNRTTVSSDGKIPPIPLGSIQPRRLWVRDASSTLLPSLTHAHGESPPLAFPSVRHGHWNHHCCCCRCWWCRYWWCWWCFWCFWCWWYWWCWYCWCCWYCCWYWWWYRQHCCNARVPLDGPNCTPMNGGGCESKK